MRNKSILLVLSTIVMAASCVGAAERARPAVPQAMDDVGPNEARVLGTLTGILSQRAASGPCAQAACHGIIRIDSVLEYGSAFPRPLSKGEHLEARFAFTLESTDEAGVTIDTPFPGVELGASFWADLQGMPAPGKTSFTIHQYYRVDE